jgi:TatD DNase family protein
VGEALTRARAHGVVRVINIGDTLAESRAGIALVEAHPEVLTTVGWHPHHAQVPLGAGEREELHRLAAHKGVVAIGEIGLDYHFTPYHQAPPALQAARLREMLELSLEVGKPVVVHDREAHADVLETLRDYPQVRAVMHCFSGDADFARACLQHGYYLSFAGPVTYPKADALRAAVVACPLSRLLIETDAPFLPPQVIRGQPNEPRWVVETAKKIAELKQISLAEVAAASINNAVTLFGAAAGL